MRARGSAVQKPQAPPGGGTALATYDASVAKIQEEKKLEKLRGGPKEVSTYGGPKVKFEETGLYKALMKKNDIEDELTKIRNLIRKRTDPSYDPDDDDFTVTPVRKFNTKVDYYKLLEVDDFSTTKDIKGAYKRLALKYHPDKNRDKKPDELGKMQEEFEKIQEAYEILSDRATRRQYDRAKFDETRARNQGLGGGWKTAETKENQWGDFTGKKKKKAATFDPSTMGSGEAQKTPKAPDLRKQVKISLDKALRGGLKILELDRDRMARAFDKASATAKTFHVPVAQGQADGSEYRMDSEGNWPSFNVTPGDLVFEFKHKPHKYLRQVGQPGEGNLEVSTEVTLRAKAADYVLTAWSPTFKGQMVLLRFVNPLIQFAPSKACTVSFRVDDEGLPLMQDATSRGHLIITIKVQLEGDPPAPSCGDVSCKEVLMRRHVRQYNHKPYIKAECKGIGQRGLPIRKYSASSAKERGGRKVDLASLLIVWESPPETDLVAFALAASALGHQAKLNPYGFLWGFHRGLVRRALPKTEHWRLSDEEIADDEEAKPSTTSSVKREKGFDFDALDDDEESGKTQVKKKGRVTRDRPESEKFMLKFKLGPVDGLPDPGSTDDDDDNRKKTNSHMFWRHFPARDAAQKKTSVGVSAAKLLEAAKETEEEIDLSRIIREKTNQMEQAQRKWANKKDRKAAERGEEEDLLRQLLENDKKREYERIEKEMNGLRSKFEFELKAEEKWRNEFMGSARHNNEYICVFKPQMVARKAPKEDAVVVRRIMFASQHIQLNTMPRTSSI